MRGPSPYTAFIERGLLMPSLDTSDVSRVPGRDVWNSWKKKLPLLASPCQLKMRSTQKYWAPTLELRSAHVGRSGSAGGCTGFGPTWQNPHDIPTRYGFTRSRDR